MKVTIKDWQAVAVWRWDLASGGDPNRNGQQSGGRPADEEDEDEDVCGICRLAFDSTCPDCKIPGDDCPLIWGQCTHIFHMHCLLKWIDTESSKGQCPMDRRVWVTAERNAAPSSPMLAPSSPVASAQVADQAVSAPSSPALASSPSYHRAPPPRAG